MFYLSLAYLINKKQFLIYNIHTILSVTHVKLHNSYKNTCVINIDRITPLGEQISFNKNNRSIDISIGITCRIVIIKITLSINKYESNNKTEEKKLSKI